ncbi:helicase-related protein [Rhizobium sp. WSM1274]|uniref:C-terminal helicase domain-containing protein n=1 Tax=Rhizobium sp. WSM1274 TaxID=3138254 RepID=UPI0021A8106F|nr:helicase-related protein [Rhizobium leguminosarum]UWU28859.1 helicase-related protein [Rhizobium leguminosarum bv. viciae]
MGKLRALREDDDEQKEERTDVVKYRADEHLELLKPFQRATTDYVFRRLFTDRQPTRQFLVADEVGLGKTMIARGVIAKAIEALVDEVERVDVVYICSNQAIAEQNLKALNVIGADVSPFNTRLTLLPLQLEGKKGIAARKINLISLTPGTALDLKSSLGTAEERALIFEMLRKAIGLRHAGIRRIFRGGVGEEKWKGWMERMHRRDDISQTIRSAFVNAVGPEILGRIREAADLARTRVKPDYRDDLRPARLIGELRRTLARICVDALQPDLIILDEFQRFAELLHEHDEAQAPEKAAAAELARALFSYSDNCGNSARLLLLSATPYRMLSRSTDDPEQGDHYADFLRTMRFLFGDAEGAARAEDLKRELVAFRRTLQSLPDAHTAARDSRDRVQTILRQVIARTERVRLTEDGNSLILEHRPKLAIDPDDLREAKAVARVARLVDAPGLVEFWKSAPYLLNFMRDYKLRTKLQEKKLAPPAELKQAIREAQPFMITEEQVEGYESIPPRNARMRALHDTTFRDGLERELWLPPCRPSFGFPRSATKTLVFSDWSLVPDAIAALLSHDASRRMGMTKEMASRASRPIGIEDMLPMLYPSATLAALIDPLELEARFGRAHSSHGLREHARGVLSEALEPALLSRLAEDRRLAVLHLDRERGRDTDWRQVPALESNEEQDESNASVRTINAISDAFRAEAAPGHAEPAIVDLLVDHALGSPATCALRALGRFAPELPFDDPDLSAAAIGVALGFRSLFNQPESRALLDETSPTNYWRDILSYCLDHDLSSVLDEYIHLIIESDRLQYVAPKDRVRSIARTILNVVSMRPAQITLDHWSAGRTRLRENRFEIRARYAMRFAAKTEDEKGIRRTGIVQAAFKSPFRPFVLATTSIGQEGLDFHPYCSRVVHWNLPRNPVEIEQREGRVHRYKNHAVRRNVASAFGKVVGQQGGPRHDPWSLIFETARLQEVANGGMGDLIPFWLYPGDAKIERVVLLPPFSREIERYEELKSSIANYRLAFGQPRQDELLELFAKLPPEAKDKLSELQICLLPRAAELADKEEVGDGRTENENPILTQTASN